MVHMTPGDLPKLPVERLAEFLVGCAKEDPTLLARSKVALTGAGIPQARLPLGAPRPRVPMGGAAPRPLEAVPLALPAAGSRADPEIEELVAIAVACSRRAEDALRHARDVSGSARRRMSVVAGTTAAGMLVATAAIVFDRQGWGAGHDLSAGAGLASMVRTLSGVSDMQREAAVQLAEVRSDMAVLRDTATTPPTTASGSVASRDVGSVTPAATGPIAASSAAQSLAGTGPAVSGPQSTGMPRASTPLAARPGPAAGSGIANLPTVVAASTEPAPTAPETPGAAEARASLTAAAPTPSAFDAPAAAAAQLLPVQAPQVRSKAYPAKPRVYREVQYYHSYRRPPPRQQFVLANVFEGMRRNIYAIFH